MFLCILKGHFLGLLYKNFFIINSCIFKEVQSNSVFFSPNQTSTNFNNSRANICLLLLMQLNSKIDAKFSMLIFYTQSSFKFIKSFIIILLMNLNVVPTMKLAIQFLLDLFNKQFGKFQTTIKK